MSVNCTIVRLESEADIVSTEWGTCSRIQINAIRFEWRSHNGIRLPACHKLLIPKKIHLRVQSQMNSNGNSRDQWSSTKSRSWVYFSIYLCRFPYFSRFFWNKSFGKEADCLKKSDQIELVFTPYITLRNGKRLYARQFGKKAFCFPRKEAPEKNTKKD